MLFSFDGHGLVIRALAEAGASKRCVPAEQRGCGWQLCYYSLMPGYSGEWRFYNSIRREFHCLHMPNNVYATTHGFQSCARSHRTRKQRHKLRLFFSTEPLQFTALNILGTSPNTNAGKQLIILVNDRFWKLLKANATKENNSNHSRRLFHQRLNVNLPNIIQLPDQ